eukprot:4279154-Pleurochrysis_carterae.AAC.1
MCFRLGAVLYSQRRRRVLRCLAARAEERAKAQARARARARATMHGMSARKREKMNNLRGRMRGGRGGSA